MAVPKKRTSISKKKIRKNFWKKKGSKAALKAVSLNKSNLKENSNFKRLHEIRFKLGFGSKKLYINKKKILKKKGGI